MENKTPIQPTKENILKLTKNGLLIFLYFNPGLKVNGTRAKNIKNPFYNDSKAAFSISQNINDGKWGYYDYGEPSFKGDCFNYAKSMYKLIHNIELDFNELLYKIYEDLDLSSKCEDDMINIKSVSYESKEPIVREKLFEIYERELDEEDLIYWSKYKIKETTLKKFNVTAVVSYRYYDYNKEKWIEINCYNKTYAYKGKGYAKIYQPNPKAFFWLGNKPKDYVFGIDLLPDWGNGDLVFLVGGEKDTMTLIEQGFNAISLSSENVNPPSYLAKEMFERGLTLVILYDIDTTGLKRGGELSKLLKCKNIILPNILIEKGGKDISDWISLGLPMELLRNVINGGHENVFDDLSIKNESYNNIVIREKHRTQSIEVQNQEHVLSNQNELLETEDSKSIFPYNAFPIKIQNIILETNKSLNFPVDFISASLLWAGSVAIGNTHKIEIKTGWQESGVLYLTLIGRPGTNKSHPISFAIKPILEADKISYNKFLVLMEEFELLNSMSKKEREEQGLQEPKKPHWLKHILSDFTPEALADIHFHNKRGIGVYADEFAGWMKNFNRYNKGSEMEFWLTLWSGKPLNIDRKSGEKIFIADPFVSVIGSMQTELLKGFEKDDKTKNGFIDRLLFVYPDNLTKPYWSENEVNPQIIESWNEILFKILNLPYNREALESSNKILKLTFEAKRELYKWQRENADQCNATENEAMSGVYSKFDVYILRLALILELFHWSCGNGHKEQVGLESVRGAIKLVEYFKLMAAKVNSIISSNNPLDKLATDKRKIYEALPSNFSTGEGVEIAKGIGMPEKTFKTFLNQKDLFKKIRHGEYEKLF